MRKLVCIGLIFLASCTFFDNPDLVPMYFNFEEVNLETNADQGVNSHNIKDVSVYADGFSIGVYNLPVSVPVLNTDESLKLDVLAVVRNNGIASNPIEYPFYKSLAYEFDFEAGQSMDLPLTFEYAEQAKIINVADFEVSNTLTVDIDGDSDIDFIRSSDTPYGSFAGKITTTADSPIFVKSSFNRINREDVLNGPVFLELDYRNTIDFNVGIVRYEPGNFEVPFFIVGLVEQEEWNKVYIELTPYLGDDIIEEFTIMIGSSPQDTSLGTVEIDNVRLVHF